MCSLAITGQGHTWKIHNVLRDNSSYQCCTEHDSVLKRRRERKRLCSRLLSHSLHTSCTSQPSPGPEHLPQAPRADWWLSCRLLQHGSCPLVAMTIAMRTGRTRASGEPSHQPTSQYTATWPTGPAVLRRGHSGRHNEPQALQGALQLPGTFLKWTINREMHVPWFKNCLGNSTLLKA